MNRSGVALAFASVLMTPAMSQDLAPPIPTGSQVEADIAAGRLRADVERPSAGPHDFQGVWFPAARTGGPGEPGGDGPPGGPPPGGVLPGGARSGGPPPGGGGDGLQCEPRRVGFSAGGGFAFGIIQSPDTMVLMNEESQNYRVIFLGGQHPAEVPHTRNGHSIGHWEDNTLVVDTVGATDRDGKASPRTIERVRKSDDGSQLIIEADGAPASRLQWRPDLFISESVCEESYAEFTVVNGMVVLTQQVRAGEKK